MKCTMKEGNLSFYFQIKNKRYYLLYLNFQTNIKLYRIDDKMQILTVIRTTFLMRKKIPRTLKKKESSIILKITSL